MKHTYEVDVLHSIVLFPGDALDGVAVVDRTFVATGRHEIVSDAQYVTQLEADGKVEIYAVDGSTATWSACCSGGHTEN